jgi:hypothetical protein
LFQEFISFFTPSDGLTIMAQEAICLPLEILVIQGFGLLQRRKLRFLAAASAGAYNPAGVFHGTPKPKQGRRVCGPQFEEDTINVS